MHNCGVGFADEQTTKFTVIGQQGRDDAFGAIKPAPHNVVTAPEGIEKSAEVTEGSACKFVATSLAFIDQRCRILRADANDVYSCRLTDFCPVNDRKNDSIVFVVILIVVAQVLVALRLITRGLGSIVGSFILQTQDVAAGIIGLLLYRTDLSLQSFCDRLEQAQDGRIRQQLSCSRVALIFDSAAS